MLESGLFPLERDRHEEDGLSLLNRFHPAGGKAFAVAYPFDGVDDGFGAVSGAQKIGVQAVRRAFRRRRIGCGRQGLAQNLSAKDILKSQILALAAEDILFDLFQFQ